MNNKAHYVKKLVGARTAALAPAKIFSVGLSRCDSRVKETAVPSGAPISGTAVVNNLAGLRNLAEQGGMTDDAVVSARRFAQVAQRLYDDGGTGCLDFLEAQRNLTTVECSGVQLRGARAVPTVALLRALGSGCNAATTTFAKGAP